MPIFLKNTDFEFVMEHPGDVINRDNVPACELDPVQLLRDRQLFVAPFETLRESKHIPETSNARVACNGDLYIRNHSRRRKINQADPYDMVFFTNELDNDLRVLSEFLDHLLEHNHELVPYAILRLGQVFNIRLAFPEKFKAQEIIQVNNSNFDLPYLIETVTSPIENSTYLDNYVVRQILQKRPLSVSTEKQTDAWSILEPIGAIRQETSAWLNMNRLVFQHVIGNLDLKLHLPTALEPGIIYAMPISIIKAIKTPELISVRDFASDLPQKDVDTINDRLHDIWGSLTNSPYPGYLKLYTNKL